MALDMHNALAAVLGQDEEWNPHAEGAAKLLCALGARITQA